MVDYKLLRNELKQNYTQHNTAEILSFIGYAIDRNFKFKLRDENSSSASISKSGTITDFGSGWSGDIVSLIHEYKGMPLGEATLYVAKLMDIPIQEIRQ
jgi:DNA primase